MEFVDWDEFLPGVTLHAPGLPSAAALHAIRAAAGDFCKRTGVWRERLEPIYLSDGVPNYDLELPHDARLVGLHGGQKYKADGSNAGQLKQQPLALLRGNWRSITGEPTRVLIESDRTARMVPIPTAATDGYTVKLDVTLRPTQNTPECPDMLYLDYEDAIQAGALARLLKMPGQPWTNPAAGQEFEATYLFGIRTVIAAVQRGHTYRGLTARPRRFV